MAKRKLSAGARALATWHHEHQISVRKIADHLNCTSAHIYGLLSGTHGPSLAMAASLYELAGVRPEDWRR